MIFVDTNYFLRFFLSDINDQHLIAKKVFEDGANGQLELFSSTIVFFEIYWTFKSYYKKSDKEIYKILKGILDMDFIYFEERSVLVDTLEMFNKSKVGMEDSYNFVYSKVKKATQFKSFDKDLLNELFKSS